MGTGLYINAYCNHNCTNYDQPRLTGGNNSRLIPTPCPHVHVDERLTNLHHAVDLRLKQFSRCSLAALNLSSRMYLAHSSTDSLRTFCILGNSLSSISPCSPITNVLRWAALAILELLPGNTQFNFLSGMFYRLNYCTEAI